MSKSRTFASVIGAVLCAAIFVGLGNWQLDRAAQVKKLQELYKELPKAILSDVATPNSNLAGDSVNRIVEFSGSYVAQYLAPNQKVQAEAGNDVKESDWNVSLMEVDGGGLILVVRGIGLIDTPRGDVSVTGRIYHRQFEDLAPDAVLEDGQLRRIDPALLLSQYSGDYYDGYVIAINEEVNGQIISIPRIAANPTKPTVPGYYWQHMAYVVIWWLMALVVLFLPLYSRWRERAAKATPKTNQGAL